MSNRLWAWAFALALATSPALAHDSEQVVVPGHYEAGVRGHWSGIRYPSSTRLSRCSVGFRNTSPNCFLN